jgi:hypothetical protein
VHLVNRRWCVSTALPSVATPNGRVIIVSTTAVHNGVDPYFVRTNRLDRESAIGSSLDGLCDLGNALNIGPRQTSSRWTDNCDLSAADKDESTQQNELLHRPNEKEISHGRVSWQAS